MQKSYIKSVVTSISLPPETHAKLKAAAKREGVGVSEFIRNCIRLPCEGIETTSTSGLDRLLDAIKLINNTFEKMSKKANNANKADEALPGMREGDER